MSAPPLPGTPHASPGAPHASPRGLCPLCGAPLRPDQDWCLRCGAAARTRLAAPPKWKGLVLGVALVALVSAVVLAVALVKLTG